MKYILTMLIYFPTGFFGNKLNFKIETLYVADGRKQKHVAVTTNIYSHVNKNLINKAFCSMFQWIRMQFNGFVWIYKIIKLFLA